MSDKLTIVLAPDSFKESLSSFEVCSALKEGIQAKNPYLEVIIAPIADGGEGTVDALTTVQGAEVFTNNITGPDTKKVQAKWGMIRTNSNTAIIEIAESSGLPLISVEQRNPMVATTYGVGELILQAIRSGAQNIIIGIGGSATNDGGAGMLQSLGFKLLDEKGNQISYGNEGLGKINTIDSSEVNPDVLAIPMIIASDVQNPLTGPTGASFVYGPQKGASEDMVIEMDENMKHFSKVVSQWKGIDLSDESGAGAAGGLGFSFLAFLNAELKSGFDLIAEITDLESKIRAADWVVTGEGKLDNQTLQGKGPYGVARMSKANRKPIIAVGGLIDKDAQASLEKVFHKIFKISPPNTSKDESLKNANKYLIDTGKRLAQYIAE